MHCSAVPAAARLLQASQRAIPPAPASAGSTGTSNQPLVQHASSARATCGGSGVADGQTSAARAKQEAHLAPGAHAACATTRVDPPSKPGTAAQQVTDQHQCSHPQQQQMSPAGRAEKEARRKDAWLGRGGLECKRRPAGRDHSQSRTTIKHLGCRRALTATPTPCAPQGRLLNGGTSGREAR